MLDCEVFLYEALRISSQSLGSVLSEGDFMMPSCGVQYRRMYERSLTHPEEFWAEMAEPFFWKRKVRASAFDQVTPSR